jgi:RimJ/RimL family protein N-acetyltransferase
MLHVKPSELRSYADTLRLASGRTLTVRFVEPEDAERLQAYFRSLARPSHYNRFLAAVQELPRSELERILKIGEERRFAVIAELNVDGRPALVGEARYAFDRTMRTVEFGMSISDAWHRLGIGRALMANLECRTAAFGAERMFGEALRSNEPMIALARKMGFSFKNASDDWRLLHFEKQIGRAIEDIPCGGSRRVAAAYAVAGLGPRA